MFQTQATNLHLIAHSMGNRVLTNAREMIEDLRALLIDDRAPSDRGLPSAQRSGRTYWWLAPQH